MSEIIFLIGYRAVGKSTVGKKLAKKIGYDFVDTDDLIVEKKMSSIKSIIAKEGWSGFRSCERDILSGLTNRKKTVVATGGGAVLHKEVWNKLKKKGTVIWLVADADVISARILAGNKDGELRPSLSGKDVCEEVETILTERQPLYQDLVDIMVDTEQMSVDEAVDIIAKEIR